MGCAFLENARLASNFLGIVVSSNWLMIAYKVGRDIGEVRFGWILTVKSRVRPEARHFDGDLLGREVYWRSANVGD